MRVALLGIALALIASCGGDGKGSKPTLHKVLIPARAETAGDELLRYLPTGADLLLELDIRRLRDNEVIGGLVKALKTSAGGLDERLLEKTDLVVFAAYNVGTAQAATITLVRGERIKAKDVANAVVVDDSTLALGPPALLGQLPKLKTGAIKSIKIDRKLLRARAIAMPAKATTGALRISASLDFDARVGMARLLGLDQVPATVSVWGDVIDDLAVVAYLGGTEKGEAEALARAATKWRLRLLRNAWVRKLFLGHVARSIDISIAGSMARIVLLVGPKRLDSIAKRLQKEIK